MTVSTRDIWDGHEAQARHNELMLGMAQALEVSQDPAELTAITAGDRPTIIRVLERATQPDYQAPDPEPLRPGIAYFSPLEIATATPEGTAWVTRGYWAFGAITELDGKIKAAGKTTLLLEAARCMRSGFPFLGQPTTPCKVVYVTEQAPGPFREALERAGLLGCGEGMRIVFRRDIAHLPWPELVATVSTDARRDGYGVVIFDTMAKLAGIREENDAGEGARAMSPLQDAAHDGLCVIVARHDRKSGGEVGESGRGSSAISGDVDVILALRRPEGNQPSTRRVIESLSRYSETPEKVVIELPEEGYVLLGDAEAVALADGVRIVSAHLGGEFEQKESWAVDELVASTELTRATVQRALKELRKRGEINVSGMGRKGDPYRYALKESVSALTHGVMGQKGIADH